MLSAAESRIEILEEDLEQTKEALSITKVWLTEDKQRFADLSKDFDRLVEQDALKAAEIRDQEAQIEALTEALQQAEDARDNWQEAYQDVATRLEDIADYLREHLPIGHLQRKAKQINAVLALFAADDPLTEI
ncbi:hypothetical protein CcrC1_gp107 [Caulobacter phage C1]|nr:hypothetical protein CcrC1_gp107 [Caulobacter phage C1]UTU08335.1 hypothetical protein CcrC2_gp107 [Caulobacter phage C2]UTU08855.1 hypothetical protein CcrJ4_gp104 [Caulobacter phage J4]UTU09409.1 hypothetical protein CcrBL47_gp123 [Caulobacter phage BL47]UTU09969.1 hypothetical protein CcrRB23_gp107 [Caulobacter phage RB23]WGN96994.1 hypothetical protein [Bertelyvirus sp.]